jgi:hypothetical protein
MVNCSLYIGRSGAAPVHREDYPLAPNSVVIVDFENLIDGPVKIECDLPVFAGERSLFQGTFNEVAAISPAALGTTQWFPWYDGVSMRTWVLVGNPSETETAHCSVWVGGVLQTGHSIAPGANSTPMYPGLQDGPVMVLCNIPVYASLRAIYQNGFDEVTGTQPR